MEIDSMLTSLQLDSRQKKNPLAGTRQAIGNILEAGSLVDSEI